MIDTLCFLPTCALCLLITHCLRCLRYLPEVSCLCCFRPGTGEQVTHAEPVTPGVPFSKGPPKNHMKYISNIIIYSHLNAV